MSILLVTHRERKGEGECYCCCIFYSCGGDSMFTGKLLHGSTWYVDEVLYGANTTNQFTNPAQSLQELAARTVHQRLTGQCWLTPIHVGDERTFNIMLHTHTHTTHKHTHTLLLFAFSITYQSQLVRTGSGCKRSFTKY